MKFKNVFLLTLAVIAVFLAFFEIFSGNMYYFRDFAAYSFPLKAFLKAELLQGRIPFLNPYLSLDAPFFANPQSGALYPVSFILLVFPLIPALKLYVILHFLLALIFMYYFTRRLPGADSWTAAYAGLVFVLSGFFLSLTEYLSILSTVVWFPLALVLVRKAVLTGERKLWLFTAVIFALQFLGGKPDHALLCAGLCYAFAIRESLSSYAKTGPFRTTLFFAFSVCLFVLLDAVQILPFLDFFSQSGRGMGSFDQVSRGSVHPLEALKFVMGDAFGNYNFDIKNFRLGQNLFSSFYVGAAPFLLALFCFCRKGARYGYSRFFAAVFLICLLLSFGRFTPLYGLLFRYFPPARFMQYPSKFMYFSIFSLAVLSATGFSVLLDIVREKNFDFLKKIIYRISVFVLVFCGLTALLFLTPRYRISALSFGQFCLASVVFLSALLFLSGRQKSADYFASFIVLFSLAGIFSHNLNVNLVRGEDFYRKNPRVAGFFKGRPEDYRILFLDDRKRSVFDFANYRWRYPNWKDYYTVHKEVMHPNINATYGFSSPDSMLVMEPKPDVKPLLAAANRGFLSLAAVRYVYSFGEIKGESYEKIGEINYKEFLYPLGVYRNRDALARAFLAGGFRVLPDRGDIMRALRGGGLDAAASPILEKFPVEKFASRFHGKTQVPRYAIISSSFKPGSTEIELESESGGLLFISRRFLPGWRCLVNGKNATVYRANLFFQAVPVEGGISRVRLSYAPRMFVPGAMVSALAFLFVALSLAKGIVK